MSAAVFISHSSRDSEVAQTLCHGLEQRGIACWISSRDITPGQNFQEAIVKALTASRVMVLVFSAHANNSDEIKKELALASQNRLAVVPVRVEDVLPTDAFKYELATRQWIDAFKDFDQAIGQLAAHVGELIGQAPTPVAPGRPAAQKNRGVGVAVLIAVLLVAAAAGAWFLLPHGTPPVVAAKPADPTGIWMTGELSNVYAPDEKFTLRLELEMSGDAVIGTVTEKSAEGGGVKRGIRDGHLSGSLVTFYTTSESTEGAYKETYRGTINGNEIAFIRQNDTASGGEPEKFTATRQ